MDDLPVPPGLPNIPPGICFREPEGKHPADNLIRLLKKIAGWVVSVFRSESFVVFAAAALVYLLLYLSPCSLLSRDSLVYLRELELWYHHANPAEVFDFGGPPLPLFLSKCLMLAGLSAHASFVALNIFSGALVCALFHHLLLRVFADRGLAGAAALILLAAPLLVENTLQAQRDVPAVAFALLGILAFEAAVRTGCPWFWPGCGVCLAAILLCRFEYVEFLLFLPLALVGQRLAGKLPGRKFVLALIIPLVSAVLALVLALLVMGIFGFTVDKYAQKMRHYYLMHVLREQGQ